MYRNTLTRIALAGLALAVLLIPGQAMAQNTSSATGTATAEIVTNPIVLTEVVPLDFGVLLPTTTNGYVTISTGGSITPYEVHVRTQGNPATWEISGEPGARVNLTLPGNGQVNMVDSTSGDTMPVDNFDHSGPNVPTLNSEGKLSFQVGAKLSVRSDQSVGVYTGSYDITASYE